MKRIIIVLLYFLGVISFSLLLVWLFALISFVFGAGDYPGDIAFVPKWIAFFSVFILLKKTETIKQAQESFCATGLTLGDATNKKIDSFFDNFFE